jgi:curved DNA-binding protein
MEFKDYYAILGVSPSVPLAEIKSAYRKLARKYHPDISKAPNAEAKFKEASEAWEALKDPEKRADYDRLRQQGWRQGQAFKQQQRPNARQAHEQADFSDFFNSLFGQHSRGDSADFDSVFGTTGQRPIKGQDVTARVSVPLDMAYQGGERTIQFATGPSSSPKALKVTIPPGITQNSKIRLPGQGAPGKRGGATGDLYLHVQLEPHPFYQVENKDIFLNLPLAPWEAALGAVISTPTLGGSVQLTIAPHSQTGTKLRLKGRGLPGSIPGDQYVILQIMVPKLETPKAKALMQQLADSVTFNPRQHFNR